MKKLIFLGLFASIACGEEVSIWDLPDTPYNSIASVHFVTNLLDNAISNLDSTVVHIEGNETITGVKEFSDSIKTPEVSSDGSLVLNAEDGVYVNEVQAGSRLVTVTMLSNEVSRLDSRIDEVSKEVSTNLVPYIDSHKWSWNSITNHPTKLSQFEDDVVTNKYLSLKGGNLTGTVSVQSDKAFQVGSKTKLLNGQLIVQEVNDEYTSYGINSIAHRVGSNKSVLTFPSTGGTIAVTADIPDVSEFVTKSVTNELSDRVVNDEGRIFSLETGKQDVLIAGNNIGITNNVIYSITDDTVTNGLASIIYVDNHQWNWSSVTNTPNYALNTNVVHATYDHDAYWISAGLNVETDGYRLTFDDDGLVLTDSESEVAITANSISITNIFLDVDGLRLNDGHVSINSNPTDGEESVPLLYANEHSYYAPSESGFIAITTNPTGRVDVDLSGYVTYRESTLYLDPEVEYDLSKFPTYVDDTLYLGQENPKNFNNIPTYNERTLYLGEESPYDMESFTTYDGTTLYLGGEQPYNMSEFPTWERENNINYLHLQDGDEYVYNLDDFVVHSELSAFPTYSGTTLYLGNNPYDMDDGLFYNRDSHNIKKLNINTASGLSGIYVNSESLQDTFNAVSNNITADLIEYTSTNYLKVSYADSYAYLNNPYLTRGIYLQNDEGPFIEVKDTRGEQPLSRLTSGGLDINPYSADADEVTRYAHNEIITGFDPFNTSSNGNHIVFPDHSGTLAISEDIENQFNGVMYLSSDSSEFGEKHISFDTELNGSSHSYVLNASEGSIQLDLDGSQYETYTSTYINDNFATKENTIESILEDGTYRVPCEGFVFETTNGVESIYIGNDSLSDIIKNTYMGNTIYSGSSASLATDTNKIVTLSDNEFAIVAGDLFMVVFDKGNTRAQITMSVNGSDSYPVHRNKDDGTSTAYSWYPGELVGFLFNGDSFIMLDGGIATTSFYGVTVLNNSVSDSEVTAATPKAVKTALTTAMSEISNYLPLSGGELTGELKVDGSDGIGLTLYKDNIDIGNWDEYGLWMKDNTGEASYDVNGIKHNENFFNYPVNKTGNHTFAMTSDIPTVYDENTNPNGYLTASQVSDIVESVITRMVETGGINRNGTNYVLVIQPQ